MVVPHYERGFGVDCFAGEEEALREAALVAFDGLASSAGHCVCVVGVLVSPVIGMDGIGRDRVLRRGCLLFERFGAVGVVFGFELDFAAGEVDVPFLVIAFDLDVVAECAEDVFEDSEAQFWW